MEPQDETIIEVLALAVLRNAVRGHELGGEPITYRRALPGIVPGHRLTIAVEKRWRFRKTEMVGGSLLHVGFSLRAIQQCGHALPRFEGGRIACPGDSDDRLREGLLANEAGEWALARCLLLDVLEQHPGCLLAHAVLGDLLSELEHRELALAHLTAAIRLGLGATSGRVEPLDASRETERALLRSLVLRARLLEALQRPEEAAADLRRALAWDPTDVAGAARPLAHLEHRLAPLPGAAAGGA